MLSEDWSRVSPQQLGMMAEYVARIEFAKRGYSIFIPEIDDRGIDFLVHRNDVGYRRIQVKSIRGHQYVFMRKKHFWPQDDLSLCLIVFSPNAFEMFLVPSAQWLTPCSVFCDRDYEGGKSSPEYGINVSKKNIGTLRAFRFNEVVDLRSGNAATGSLASAALAG